LLQKSMMQLAEPGPGLPTCVNSCSAAPTTWRGGEALAAAVT